MRTEGLGELRKITIPCYYIILINIIYSCQHINISTNWSLLLRTSCFGTCLPSSGRVLSYNYALKWHTWNEICGLIQELHLLEIVYYIYYIWPPLWSNDQSSWLHIQRSWFDSRCYQIFKEVVGLERGPLSLLSTEELLERKSNGSSLENREYGRRHPSRWPRGTQLRRQTAVALSVYSSLADSGHGVLLYYI
jgi:hypothetical protein